MSAASPEGEAQGSAKYKFAWSKFDQPFYG